MLAFDFATRVASNADNALAEKQGNLDFLNPSSLFSTPGSFLKLVEDCVVPVAIVDPDTTHDGVTKGLVRHFNLFDSVHRQVSNLD